MLFVRGVERRIKWQMECLTLVVLKQVVAMLATVVSLDVMRSALITKKNKEKGKELVKTK